MKVSIITVTYNSEKFLHNCMESVLKQDYEDIEHIFIDGGSTDDTLRIINECKGENSVVISEPDKGIYDALNKGLKLATGDIIGLLHSDDMLADNCIISEIVSSFEDTNADVLYGDLNYISGNSTKKNIVRHWKSNSFKIVSLKYGWMPPHPTLYCRKEVFEKLGIYDISYKIAADYDFILRLFSANDISTYYLPKVLVNMTLGGVSNQSLKSVWCKTREDLRVVRKNNIGGLYTVFFKNIRKLKQFLH